MKTYVLSIGQSVGYKHPAPERTAYKAGRGTFADNTYKIWPSREAMAHTIRMQERRERLPGDWHPLVKLGDGEGYSVRSNPSGDVEDIQSQSALPTILESIVNLGQFTDRVPYGATPDPAGKVLTIDRAGHGPYLACIATPNGEQYGPTVAIELESAQQLADVYHYALHHGTLEGWAPGSNGYAVGRMENPSRRNPDTKEPATMAEAKKHWGYTRSVLNSAAIEALKGGHWFMKRGYPAYGHEDGTSVAFYRLPSGSVTGSFRHLGAHRNPDMDSDASSESAELYEAFHGKPSTETLVYEDTIESPDSFAVLGELIEMKVATVTGKDATLSGFGGAVLASNDAGTQLYIVGGDQALDLDSLAFSPAAQAKDSITVGILYEITYRTEKQFHKFELTEYFHQLGEETGEQPTLIYDVVNAQLSVSGGAYEVKPEGIVN
jgi:hypothetical protein